MLAVTLALLLAALPPQEPAPPPPGPPPQGPPPQGEALRLFLDCPQWVCDLDFMRTEIGYVNYVRDRADAQLQILVSRQQTGGGGTEYTLTFIGLREFQGQVDTLRWNSNATSTEDEVRHGLARVIRLGLVRYLVNSPVAARLDVRYAAPPNAAPRARPRDPWNFWVFSISFNGWFNGEKSYRSQQLYSSLSANRTTDRWKTNFSVSTNQNRNWYLTSDTSSYAVTQKSYYANALAVRSLGPHWSVGGRADMSQESYRNIKLRWSVDPAIEYSVFPYSQSTRRLLLFRYVVGPEVSSYDTTTIYFRTGETRLTHGVEATYNVTQPWGSTSVSSYFSQYLHDMSKLHLDVWGNASLRLVRGLSLELFGEYTVIHDQLYLSPEPGQTVADVIAKRRQLATSYQYYGSVGLSYRIGSVFNNIVNPRFR